MKRFLKSYVFNFLLIVVFTGIVLVLTLKDTYQDVLNILVHAHPFLLFLVFCLAFTGQCLLGWILKSLTCLSKPDYRFHQGLVNALVASFFHGVTPSASGGQFAQVFVFRKQGVSISDSASILWMDFILYQSTMVAVSLVLFLLRFRHFCLNSGTLGILVVLGLIVNCCVIGGLYAVAHIKQVYWWLTTTGLKIGVRFRIIKDEQKAFQNLSLQITRFETEMTRLKSHRGLIIKVVLMNVFRQLLYYSIPYFCALALGIQVQIQDFLNILALTSFVSMVNCFIPIPGSSGGTEATFIYMFSTLFDKIEATGMMILWRFSTYYFIMILGGLTFVFQRVQLFYDERGNEQ